MKSSIGAMVRLFGGMTLLVRQIFQEIFRPPYYLGLLAEQIYQIGIRSGPLVFVTAASTGMVMALQFGLGLEKFGGKLYVPKIVSLSIIRELGPAFTCLMLAARVGAGITSELGSMTVTQQVDAIRALGTSPIKKIVIPRLLACLISFPLLVAIANILGVLGGLLVGTNDLKLDPLFYIQKVYETIGLSDYFAGIGKAPFFAIFVALPACYYGLNVTGGTQGVGNATTKSVVTSSVFILIGDYFLTKIFWMLDQWL
jgi:phospholipid/cholesterol/gamma-HCH transport system permease protein